MGFCYNLVMLDSLTHHAYSMAGQRETILLELLLVLKKNVGYKTEGNPDFRLETYDLMGIDEARALKAAAELTGVTGGKKVFVVSARGVTTEAQNALLKVLEEPPANTHFFLIVPTFEMLLPTLRSRLSSLAFDTKASEGVSSLASDFLAASAPKRLKTIQALLKEAEEDSGKQKLAAFLDELERALAEKERSVVREALAEVLEVKKYSRDRAPSFKLLLEHLALVLPQQQPL